MRDGLLLTFNAGSSTVKIGIYQIGTAGVERLAKGVIDFRDEPLAFHLRTDSESVSVDLKASATDDPVDVIRQVFDWLTQHFDLSMLRLAGHRVVHGGNIFSGAVSIDDATLEKIESLATLAPLHQPQSLRLIRAIRQLRPELQQTASFDTAFHAGAEPLARRFAIPRHLHDQGIQRYGFHGLSYKYIAGELARRLPDVSNGRVIAAHLGSGASLCGMHGGMSRDTSMGFSTLDGIPMATRCGALDPGVILHMLGPLGLGLPEVEDILYHKSGLLGVSGFEADTRELLQSDDPAAREALDLFVFRIAGEIARISATLGGLDALAFSAGIGENQPEIRARICSRLAWLGVELDPQANLQSSFEISTTTSEIRVLVIPTDEEQVIASEACEILQRVS